MLAENASVISPMVLPSACGLRDRGGADDGVAAGAIVDDHRLTQRLRQLVGHGPRHHIGAATGRIGHDPADRAIGPGLRQQRWYRAATINTQAQTTMRMAQLRRLAGEAFIAAQKVLHRADKTVRIVCCQIVAAGKLDAR